MKKIIAMFLAVLIAASLAGCGSNDADTVVKPEKAAVESNVAVAPVESTPEETIDPAGTPTEAADPDIPTKYDNPNDDPRMIVQKNWESQYPFAFIDEYNLIGYSSKDDAGAGGANYYLDENAEYIPEAATYMPYFTHATGVKGPKIADGKAIVDLENWAKSFNIDIFEMSDDDGNAVLYVKNSSGKELTVWRDSFFYEVPVEGSRPIVWHFGRGDFDNHGEPLYALAFGKRSQISNNFQTLWIIEQGFKALEADYAGSPW